MGGYDKSLDKEIEVKVLEFPDRNTNIKVSIMEYNGGAKKLQLSRVNFDPNTQEEKFAKLGRLTKAEVGELIPVLSDFKGQLS